MNGIKIEAGVNDCYYNTDGRCTKLEKEYHDKVNCVMTQLGVHICSYYVPSGKIEESRMFEKDGDLDGC